jgi:hypothetical protein
MLLSTAWFSSVEPGKETVVVNMEKKRIKESPPYESGAAVDREYEARLHDYYGTRTTGSERRPNNRAASGWFPAQRLRPRRYKATAAL